MTLNVTSILLSLPLAVASVYWVALRWRSRRESGGGLIQQLQTVFRPWVTESFLSWIFGWSLGWATLWEPGRLVSPFALECESGGLCPWKGEVAVKSPSSRCPWLPPVDKLPVRRLASLAAAGGRQLGFSKDLLSSVSCDVTSLPSRSADPPVSPHWLEPWGGRTHHGPMEPAT